MDLTAITEELPAIRERLVAETAREAARQGAGDTELMKLCCVQLFHAGELADVLLIWRAKRASMDAAASIDLQLLCGAGVPATRAHLHALDSDEARAALARIAECEADFAEPANYRAFWAAYYK